MAQEPFELADLLALQPDEERHEHCCARPIRPRERPRPESDCAERLGDEGDACRHDASGERDAQRDPEARVDEMMSRPSADTDRWPTLVQAADLAALDQSPGLAEKVAIIELDASSRP